ncbi:MULTISPECIES: DNA-binding protein [unclassified Neptuniibacter]|uniref:DNA-binding protein n=1 Tax=unclassified Neptuniibacter TaxID=2630693 RepID=UPI000C4A1E99|nr:MULTISPECIES: DNA-binding protein [unclassified Neptuniibacter]MAY43519.1 hypothetical protein [Oceanospirillaceae bacterium]|tara:strand:+ start:3455 stop:4156 length:702 start_codon:yes stop_codon:yes gene_type:complete
MKKKGDTQAAAKAVADELLKEGIRPTQQNVRDRLGSGSITTINKALNAWWQELGDRFKANTSHPMLPDPVAEMASKLWAQALLYSERELEERRVELELDYREKLKEQKASTGGDQEELKELRAQCLRLLQENEKQGEQKLALQGRVFEQENQIIGLQSASEKLDRELKQMQVVSRGSNDIDEYIELQVINRTLKEESKRINKQLEQLVNDKSELLYENMKLKAELESLKFNNN